VTTYLPIDSKIQALKGLKESPKNKQAFNLNVAEMPG
jgi:hypothetical protein